MAKKKKKPKLNSMRVLEAHQVPYEVCTYSPDQHSGQEVAEQIGASLEQVYKTLVVQRQRDKPLLVMLARDRQLDLKSLAASVGEKKLQMAPHREAESLTGLQVGGISALALLNRSFDIFIDQAATAQSHVYISAGQRGVNLRLAVQDLLRVTGARVVQATN